MNGALTSVTNYIALLREASSASQYVPQDTQHPRPSAQCFNLATYLAFVNHDAIAFVGVSDGIDVVTLERLLATYEHSRSLRRDLLELYNRTREPQIHDPCVSLSPTVRLPASSSNTAPKWEGPENGEYFQH